jgi:LPXTG-motif cell wall-anchored protein
LPRQNLSRDRRQHNEPEDFIMRRLIHVSVLFTGLIGYSGVPSAQAGLVATYQFNDTLSADQAGAPDLIAINGGSFVADTPLGQLRTVYERTAAGTDPSQQSVLRLDTTPLGLTSNNYAVELVFTFTTDSFSSPNYRRIVDSYDPSSLQDPGLYYGRYNTLDIFYGSSQHPGGPIVTRGIYYDVLLSVSPTGEQAYLNGALAVDVTGTPDQIATHFLSFFQDNAREYGDGKVALIRVFDSALTAEQASYLYNNGNPFAVPEPSSLTLAGLGGLSGFGLWWSRKRRNAVPLKSMV